jgi:hypothetical protein
MVVLKFEERKALIKDIHKEIRHFSERRTLIEVKKRFFWHDRTETVIVVLRQCQCCQFAKNSRSIKLGVEEIKNIPIYDLFYRVALDTIGPFPETKDGNMYALVAIDHYSKWCEARPVKDHDVVATPRFLEEEIICRFSVPKFILTNNGGEWMAKFDMMCKKYGIIHQFTTPQWLQCNKMVERMMKTLKSGLSVVSFTNLIIGIFSYPKFCLAIEVVFKPTPKIFFSWC